MGKNMGHAVGGEELENRGQEPLSPQKRAPKKLKNFYLKKYRKVCVEKLT